ncbi:MAG: DUF1178 family protein [Pseudomonadota bacterium]
MIVFDLRCAKNHEFEAWFRDNDTFKAQAENGQVPCPVCGSTKVGKALMAPFVANAKKKADTANATLPVPADGGPVQKAAMESQKAGEVRKALREMRETIEKNFDYVGGGFAEEARKIHYGESEERNIYGETSDDEAKALHDEGVKVSRIPWLPKENS